MSNHTGDSRSWFPRPTAYASRHTRAGRHTCRRRPPPAALLLMGALAVAAVVTFLAPSSGAASGQLGAAAGLAAAVHTAAAVPQDRPQHPMAAHAIAARELSAQLQRREIWRDARQAGHRAWLRQQAAIAARRAAAPAVATAAPQAPAPAQGAAPNASGFEACVIQRESGGNPAVVNPTSGAGGLFQFLPSTWASLGYAASYPGGAQTAPVSVQVAAFWALYDQAGPGPWSSDGC